MIDRKGSASELRGFLHKLSSAYRKLGDLLLGPGRFHDILLALNSVICGFCAGALAFGLMDRLQRIVPVGVAAFYFIDAGLGLLIAGIAAGWYLRWTAHRDGRLHSLLAAGLLFVFLFPIAWYAMGWHAIWSVWPLVVADMVIILLVGIDWHPVPRDR